jgi:site-specific DNA-cytosine methylase
MLRSLDLFSGVGGITHALRGLATPVMYCEKDPDCHVVMNKLQRQGKLPKAPIHDDIARLTARTVPGKVDMIVAGFPCIGFSTSGKREGLDQVGSRLFYHVMRLAKDIRPPFMFFENVDAILGNSDITKIVSSIRKLGYDMYWVVLPAFTVGSPQKRGRWFCLCVRRGVAGVEIVPSEHYARHSWKKEPSVRMVPPTTPGVRRRMRMLGNGVVPDCVRAAFLSLWTGCVEPVPRLLAASTKGSRALKLSPPAPQGKLTDPKHKAFASVVNGVMHRIHEPPGLLPAPQLPLVLDPRAYRTTKAPNPNATSGLITKPKPITMWSTIRAGNGAYAMNVLTNRGSHDLASQLRFERRTPASQRGGVTNPEWGEWLQGLPRGWTAAS